MCYRTKKWSKTNIFSIQPSSTLEPETVFQTSGLNKQIAAFPLDGMAQLSSVRLSTAYFWRLFHCVLNITTFTQVRLQTRHATTKTWCIYTADHRLVKTSIFRFATRHQLKISKSAIVWKSGFYLGIPE